MSDDFKRGNKPAFNGAKGGYRGNSERKFAGNDHKSGNRVEN